MRTDRQSRTRCTDQPPTPRPPSNSASSRCGRRRSWTGWRPTSGWPAATAGVSPGSRPPPTGRATRSTAPVQPNRGPRRGPSDSAAGSDLRTAVRRKPDAADRTAVSRHWGSSRGGCAAGRGHDGRPKLSPPDGVMTHGERLTRPNRREPSPVTRLPAGLVGIGAWRPVTVAPPVRRPALPAILPPFPVVPVREQWRRVGLAHRTDVDGELRGRPDIRPAS